MNNFFLQKDLKSKKHLVTAMTIETTMQSMFKEMGVKTLYIGKSLDDSQRATVIFQGPENVLYDIFMNPEIKPIVEASGHIYEGTKITRWIS